jgi:hypothetical protein
MKTLMNAAAKCFAVIAALISLPDVGHAAGLRTALVIGSGSYGSITPLRTPVEDADAIADALSKLGFHVIPVHDATLADLRAGLHSLKARLTSPHDTVVIYYAGHGLQIEGKSYLVPVDFPAAPPADFQRLLLPLTEVMEPLSTLGDSGTKLIFLDACRDNPLVDKLKTQRGLAQPPAGPLNSVIGYATEPDNVAEDGSWKHSPYTKALLRDLGRVGQDIDWTLRNVRNYVVEMTDGTQVPWVALSMPSPYYFRPPVVVNASMGAVDDAAVVFVNGAEVLSSAGRRAASATLSPGTNDVTVAVFNQKTYTGNNPIWGKAEGWRVEIAFDFGGLKVSALPNGQPSCGLDQRVLRLNADEDEPPRHGTRHGGLFVAARATIEVEEFSGAVKVVTANCSAWKN